MAWVVLEVGERFEGLLKAWKECLVYFEKMVKACPKRRKTKDERVLYPRLFDAMPCLESVGKLVYLRVA